MPSCELQIKTQINRNTLSIETANFLALAGKAVPCCFSPILIVYENIPLATNQEYISRHGLFARHHESVFPARFHVNTILSCALSSSWMAQDDKEATL